MPGKYFCLCCCNCYLSVISLMFFEVRLDWKCFGAEDLFVETAWYCGCHRRSDIFRCHLCTSFLFYMAIICHTLKKYFSFLNSLLDNVSTVDGFVQLGVKPCRTAEVMACAVSSYTFWKRQIVMSLTDLGTIIKPSLVVYLQAAGKQFYSIQGLKYWSCCRITDYTTWL